MSTHREEVDVLRSRSLRFLEEARSALEKGFHDVSCFLAEQSLQLFLKSVLLELIGDYPRTHSIRRLLGELRRLLRSEELEDFIRVNRVRISVLEDAYLMARYFIKEYSAEDSKDMIKLAEDLMKLISKLLGEGVGYTESSILRARMLREWREWVRRIARVARELIPDAEVYVIGSIIRGDYTGGSDVDVLIVSPNAPKTLLSRAKVKVLIEERLNLPHYHPFEIHVLRPEEAEAYLRRAGGCRYRVV